MLVWLLMAAAMAEMASDGLRWVARTPEKARRRMFGRCGEGKVAGITRARARALPNRKPLLLGQLLPLRLALFCQHVAQVIGRAAAGGAVASSMMMAKRRLRRLCSPRMAFCA